MLEKAKASGNAGDRGQAIHTGLLYASYRKVADFQQVLNDKPK